MNASEGDFSNLYAFSLILAMFLGTPPGLF